MGKFISKVNLGHMEYWTPWRGCKKISEACENCYIRYNGPVTRTSQDIPRSSPGTIIALSLQTDFFLLSAQPARSVFFHPLWRG